MTARTRWTLVIAAFLIGNVLAVSVLVAFSRGDMKRRLVPGYEQESTPAPPAPTPPGAHTAATPAPVAPVAVAEPSAP
ncbi:MAG: hypothetical protein K8W52_37735 [Deltaproteobacteria bacterium]|nr:hypothetical protein [Deltaproteobacteria bacterium]